jgi:A/G-specific adenine glycosylase
MKHATTIRRELLAWYRREARDLPWRQTTDPYLIWLSEVILQQTRVDQGMPYYLRFVDRFPTVGDLAAADIDEVLKLWEGLGYYTRARNLHKAARAVVEDYGGEMPKEAAVLQMLPGIGRYTAAAVASIAFGERVAVVDGNVKRVLSRLFDETESIDDREVEARLWEQAQTLLPQRDPGDFNQAMMELGARLCVPKTPRCEECPVANACEAHKLGVAAARPVRTKKKPVPKKEFVVAALQKDGEYLLAKRPESGLLGGLWEFPQVELARGESHQQALSRLGEELLGVQVKVGGLIATAQHTYTHMHTTLTVYRCSVVEGDPAPTWHTAVQWLGREGFDRVALPKANHKFLAALP